MYRYKIGYNSFEESFHKEIEHEKKFDNGEMTQMIAEAIEALFPEKNETYYKHEFQFDRFWRGTDFNSFDAILVDWLIKNKGFKKIEYELEWSVCGYMSVLDKEDWMSSRTKDDELSKITDYLNSKGITKEKFLKS